MKQLISATLLGLVSLNAVADDVAATRAKLEEAINSNVRTEKEKARDEDRKPLETLLFFGLRDTMKVVELIPAGGWYTKILVPVLHEKGEYVALMNTNRIKERILNLPGFERGKVIEPKGRYWRENGSPLLNVEIETPGIKNADLVLTFRNYANFTADSRHHINSHVFDMLKPGGIYGVVTYTARHMAPPDHSKGQRFDPVLAIKEITGAGFEFEGFSDLHYLPQDDLTQDASLKKVRARADRWTMKFRKPRSNPTHFPEPEASAPVTTEQKTN